MPKNDSKVIKFDDRSRAVLPFSHTKNKRYLVSELADGTIIMRPAVVLTRHEYEELRREATARR